MPPGWSAAEVSPVAEAETEATSAALALALGEDEDAEADGCCPGCKDWMFCRPWS